MTPNDIQQCDIPEKIRREVLPKLKTAGVRDRIVVGYLGGIAWGVAVDAAGDIDDEFAAAMTEEEFAKVEAGFKAVGAVYGTQQAQAALASMASHSQAIN